MKVETCQSGGALALTAPTALRLCFNAILLAIKVES